MPERCQVFFSCTRSRHFGEGRAQAADSVRVASRQFDLAMPFGEFPGRRIGASTKVSVQYLHGREKRCEQIEISLFSSARNSAERMIETEEKAFGGNISDQREEVIPPSLQLSMLPLGNVEDAHVQPALRGQQAAYFLTEEEIRLATQDFGGVD
jgi:hypothetical protein